MSDKSFLKLGEIYGGILNSVPVVTEKVAKLPTKPGPGAKDLNDKTAGKLANQSTTGPTKTGGYMQIKPKSKNETLPDSELSHDEDEEDQEKVGKTVTSTLNNFMANKSIFDKLFESVMKEETDELQELGIPSDDTEDDASTDPFAGDLGDDLGDDLGEDEVTITLSKDLAQKLHDVLMTVLDHGEDEMGEDEMGEDEMEDEIGVERETAADIGLGMEEDEETMGGVDVRKNSVDVGKKNKVGTTTGSAATASNDGKYTTGDGSLKPAPKPDFGKSNKVHASKIKPGSFVNK